MSIDNDCSRQDEAFDHPPEYDHQSKRGRKLEAKREQSGLQKLGANMNKYVQLQKFLKSMT